jgi:hypothetical protein
VTPSAVQIAPGESVSLSAAVLDTLGRNVPKPAVAWTTLQPAVATVSSSGVATGIAGGTASIVATSGAESDTAVVTVSGSAPPPTGGTAHRGYYASPAGTSTGSGSLTSPWSLATALAGGNGKVQPGDTIWLRGGTYGGKQVSTVAGVSGKPVVVRQYPGERAILDANGITGDHFVVKGGWTVFMDFEVTNTNTTRYFNSTSNGQRPNNVVNNASNTKYINLTLHDGGVAFYNYAGQTNVEVYGCLIYNNGWMGSDRGHGHGLYLISNSGPVVAKDNVIFGQFGYGIHAYVNAGSGSLNNIRLEGNVAFNNGTLATSGTSANILYGGGGTADGAVVSRNMAFHSPGVSGTNVRVGHGSTLNGSASVRDNYAVGGSVVFDMGYWRSAAVSGNTFVGASRIVQLNDPSTSGTSFDGNSHRRDPSSASWAYQGSSYSFTGWRSVTGLGGSDVATSGTPTSTYTIVRANPHVPGRAIIVVYNWGGMGSTSVGLPGVLEAGDAYAVRNAQTPFGAPVAAGSYGGSVTVPLNAVTPVPPIGWSQKLAPSTGSAFAVFIVEKQ